MTTLAIFFVCAWSFKPTYHDPDRQPQLVLTRVYIDRVDETGEIQIGTGWLSGLDNGYVQPITRGGEYTCE